MGSWGQWGQWCSGSQGAVPIVKIPIARYRWACQPAECSVALASGYWLLASASISRHSLWHQLEHSEEVLGLLTYELITGGLGSSEMKARSIGGENVLSGDMRAVAERTVRAAVHRSLTHVESIT